MLEELVEYIKEKNHLAVMETRDYGLKGYALKDYVFMQGNASYLKRDEFLHHEEYLAIVPIFKDAPVLEILTEKKKIHMYLLDLCLEKNRRYQILSDFLDKEGQDEKKEILSLQAYTASVDKLDVLKKYTDLYFDMVEDMPVCDPDDKRKILKTYVFNLYAGNNMYSSAIIKKIGLEEARDLYEKYLYFAVDISLVNHENDKKICNLLSIILKDPEAGYMLVFRGRSISATYSTNYMNSAADGTLYQSIAFWDGDSGNLFDICYSLVPEAVYRNGEKIEF